MWIDSWPEQGHDFGAISSDRAHDVTDHRSRADNQQLLASWSAVPTGGSRRLRA
jgi:hypothetical protein